MTRPDHRSPRLAFVVDDVFLGHRPPGAHPERPERLGAVRQALEIAGLADGERLPIRAITDDEILRVHTVRYLGVLKSSLAGSAGYLDADTYFSQGSWPAAQAAAAAAVDLTLAALSGRAPRGFAIVRPPGHHAEPDRAMGFCLLNNVAIAAAAARARGAQRVAIVDWDVHHGNGTQAAFFRDASVMYLSVHQFPFYPGTGASDEIGAGAGEGTTVNVPLPAGAGDVELDLAFDQVLVPALRAFAPDIILVSAGYDAYVGDPLANLNVSVAGYTRAARKVYAVAQDVCDGKMVCVLEGGYDLAGLGACAAATWSVLKGETAAAPEGARLPGDAAARARVPMAEALAHVARTRRALAKKLPFDPWP